MMLDYLTVYAFALAAALFAAASIIAACLLRPKVPDPIKTTSYECGIPAVGTTEIKTNVRFYVYALLFVIFEVETLYVYPWAVIAGPSGAAATAGMLVFLAVLFAGLVYAWKKGALQWE